MFFLLNAMKSALCYIIPPIPPHVGRVATFLFLISTKVRSFFETAKFPVKKAALFYVFCVLVLRVLFLHRL
jgi:hypothetical protein